MGVKVRERPPGSGVYWVFVNHRGKRKAKKVGSEKAALKVKEQIEARLTLGKSAFPEDKKKTGVPTLAEYYERFQRNYLNVAVTSSTRISYDVSFRKHILPEFGNYRLDEITRSMVKDFIAKLVERQTMRFNRQERKSALELLVEQWPDQALKAKKFLLELSSWLKSNPATSTQELEQHLAESLKLAFGSQDAGFHKKAKQLILKSVVIRKMARPSIRIILSELTAVLNSAIEDGIISENPAKRLTKFYKSAPVMHEEIQPLTHEEVPLFLETTLQHSPEYYPLFLCAIHTGLRSGELTGLQWGDIDWSGKFLTVRRNIVRGNVHRTKTGSTRRVDMSDTLLTELSNLKRLRREEWLSRGMNEIPEWIFCNREGNAIDMHNVINRHFKKCLAKAGLRQIRWHDLRYVLS
jgi:integrase